MLSQDGQFVDMLVGDRPTHSPCIFSLVIGQPQVRLCLLLRHSIELVLLCMLGSLIFQSQRFGIRSAFYFLISLSTGLDCYFLRVFLVLGKLLVSERLRLVT